MNTKSTIQSLIDQTKKLPNSLERNKLVSHLENARLIAALMEYQTGERYDQTFTPDLPEKAYICTCPTGGRDTMCAVHSDV